MFLRPDLILYLRLALNLGHSSCPSLLGGEILALGHHALLHIHILPALFTLISFLLTSWFLLHRFSIILYVLENVNFFFLHWGRICGGSFSLSAWYSLESLGKRSSVRHRVHQVGLWGNCVVAFPRLCPVLWKEKASWAWAGVRSERWIPQRHLVTSCATVLPPWLFC